MTKPDDWAYARRRHQHFTDAEITRIQKAFMDGREPREVAREMECSSRVIYTHFARLRGHTFRTGSRRANERKPKQKRNLPSRHYKSSFEIA